jgi:hypothetical protein
MPYQMKDPADVAREFAAEPQDYAVFVDNNLGSRHEYLLRLRRELRPLAKISSAAVSIDVTDRPDVFERTSDWIGDQRLECATLNILAPQPGTPLHAQLKTEGRLLHENWDLYDTAHVAFRPKRMSPDQPAEGYAASYGGLFSRGSIWRRRPKDRSAVPP